MLPRALGFYLKQQAPLIKKFSIVFFPNLQYTFITYNGRKSNE